MTLQHCRLDSIKGKML